MVSAPVYSVDDREGGPLQFVVEPARYQPPDNRIAPQFGVKHKLAGAAINSAFGQATVDALNNVAALAQRAKNAFGFLRDHPLSRAERRRKAEPLQLARASDEHCPLDIHGLMADGPKVDYPFMAARPRARAPGREASSDRRRPAARDLGESPARCAALKRGRKLYH